MKRGGLSIVDTAEVKYLLIYFSALTAAGDKRRSSSPKLPYRLEKASVDGL